MSEHPDATSYPICCIVSLLSNRQTLDHTGKFYLFSNFGLREKFPDGLLEHAPLSCLPPGVPASARLRKNSRVPGAVNCGQFE